MSALIPYFAIRRPPSFSRRLPWLTTSWGPYARRAANPRRQSSPLTCWTWIRGNDTTQAETVTADIAFLQYTSGSTRTPAGVMVSNKNLMTNFGQLMADLFADDGNLPPPDTTIVSWLPFYHDMGLMVGIFVPVLAGLHAVLMSPVAFLQRPARWMQLLASNRHAFSSAPNFAFEIAAKKTSDEDMAGLDLGEVRGHRQR